MACGQRKGLTLIAAAFLLPWSPASAFEVRPEMLGKLSYVRLELDGEGGVASSLASTPDSTQFVTPNFGTTRLCRTNPEDRNSEPANCRTYAIYIPGTYDGQSPLPLHLSLHGNGGFAEAQIGNIAKNDGTGNSALDNSGLEGRYNELAERHGFAVVYPNGRINAGETVVNGRNWNDCRKLNPVLRNGNPNTTYSDADDVGFISALLDDVSAALRIDAQRVYAHGYSNGAMMVLRLYQELGHRFAAFATTAGNMPVLEPINYECALPFTAPKKPVQLMFGDLDYVVPYYGGCVLDGVQAPLASVPSLYCQRGNLMSADQTIDFFAAHLGTVRPGPADLLWPLSWRMVHERIYTDGVPANVNGGEEPPDSGGRTAYSARVYGAGNSTGYFRDYRADDGGDLVRVKKIHNGGHTLSGLRPVTNATTAALLGPKNLDAQVADELYAFFNQFDSRCGPRNISLGPVYDQLTTRPDVYPWQMVDGKNGFLQDDSICFPSRKSGAHLRGYLFAPRNFNQHANGSLPVVVIGPGSVNGQALYYQWSARELAAKGYLVLVQDPQGLGRSETVGDPALCGPDGCPGVPFQSADSFVDGFRSALDFVESKNHPWLVKADLTRIGIAGHSLSARSAAYVGGVDERAKAVVAWDNMAGDLDGDEGTPSGEGACAALIGGELPGVSTPITPRVPTMGMASDANGTCNYEKNLALALGNDPELKKAGYRKWQQAGIAAMQLAFHGSAHGDWAQSAQSNVQELEVFQYYTRAWFDLYLKGDEAARQRLLAENLQLSNDVVLDIGDNAANKNGSLSRKFRSAVFMPEAGITGCEALIATTASTPTTEKTPCVPVVLPQAPTLSDLLDLVLDEGQAAGPLAFTVGDPDTSLDNLTLSAQSDNTTLVPNDRIVFGGSGANRTVSITPVLGQTGIARITLSVSDGGRTATDSFALTVRPLTVVVSNAIPAKTGAVHAPALLVLWLALCLQLAAGVQCRVQDGP